jgi:alkane 1-monooxygenase
MILFALATLAPLAAILAGALAGGPWVWIALALMTVVTAGLDALVHRALPPGGAGEFPAADALNVALALGQFAILAAVARAFGRDDLTGVEKAGLFLAAALHVGQVGNANAHELIHRGARGLRRLGMWAYVSILFGHHTSAHVLVHHVRVATRADPSTARRGESLYRFFLRAWRGSFREGFRAESARLAQAGRGWWHHPYLAYVLGAGGVAALASALGGVGGLLAHLGLALMAQAQLLMSDYVQHYGLLRAERPDGRPEPVDIRHSWNSPHPASSALMLNAPRHSDHHAHPARRYPALALPDGAPLLPRSLPVMACLALAPRLWRRVMDPRVAALTRK